MSREQVNQVEKRGEWYTVKGRVGDKSVSVDIPAPDVEKLSRGEAEKLFKRGLKTVSENEA